MATLNTSMLSIPGTSLGIVQNSAADAGILGRLSPEKPTLFGPVKGATFSGDVRAEIVGESDPKSASNAALVPFSADPIKLHVGIRTSDEFLWADEDYRMGIIDDLVAPAFGRAMGRAADLIAFHGINPKTGAVSAKVPKYLSQTTKAVEMASAPNAELTAAVGLAGGSVNGIAIDGDYAFSLATETYADGRLINESMGFGDVTNFRGLKAAKSTTVSGQPEVAAATNIAAFVGDWSQVRWGFQREIPMELIKYGDPDNTGRDLKGHNETFLRSEVVIYVAIGDLAMFAKVHNLVA